MKLETTQNRSLKKKSYLYALSMIGMLFFVFGFLTWINGVLIPYFKICMQLSNFEATLVAFSAYSAYFLMALPSASVLKLTGYRKGMVLGLIVMAVGTLLFIPAAQTRLYPLFLGGLFVTASGLALVQTAANPYIAIMGPIESTAQRVGFMGIANKGAGIICLTILGGVFLTDADIVLNAVQTMNEQQKAVALDTYILKIIEPYLIISAVLLLVALVVYFSKLPEVDERSGQRAADGRTVKDRDSVLSYPYLILGVVALFMAGACETIPIDGIIIYSDALNIPIDVARHYSTYTLFIMLLGYIFVSALVPKYFSQQKALLFASVWGLLFTVAAYFTQGHTSVYCLLLLGFSAAMLWGTIWGLALRGLGAHTKKGSALLIMSLIGGGVLPLLFGSLLDTYAGYPQTAVLVLIPCYLLILVYATHGHKIEHWKKMTHET